MAEPQVNVTLTNADKAHIANLFRNYRMGYSRIAAKLGLSTGHVQSYVRRHLGTLKQVAQTKVVTAPTVARIAKQFFSDHKDEKHIAAVSNLPLPTVRRVIAEQQAKRIAKEERARAKAAGFSISPHHGLTVEQADKVQALLAQGLSIYRIAKQLGVGWARVNNFLTRHGSKGGVSAPAPVANTPIEAAPVNGKGNHKGTGYHHHIISAEQRQQAIVLRQEGKTFQEIAETFGVSKKTLSSSVYSYLNSQKKKQGHLVPSNGHTSKEPQQHANPAITDREEVRLAIARAIGYTSALISFTARSVDVSEAQFGRAFCECLSPDFARHS